MHLSIDDEVGMTVAFPSGASVGVGAGITGTFVGATTGMSVTGEATGMAVTGAFVGVTTGMSVIRASVGLRTGMSVGATTGKSVGATTGISVGAATGASVGGSAGQPHASRNCGSVRSSSLQNSAGISPLSAAN